MGSIVCLLFFCGESSEVRLFEQRYGFGGKCMVGIKSAGKTNLVLPARILHTAPLSSEQALLSCYSAKSSFMSSTAEYATDVPGPNMAETPAL